MKARIIILAVILILCALIGGALIARADSKYTNDDVYETYSDTASKYRGITRPFDKTAPALIF